MFSRPLLWILLLLVALPDARAGEPETAGRGTLRIVTNYWADVYVDGKRKGRAPTSQPISLPAGPHVVSLLGNPRVKGFRREVIIRVGETTELRVNPESPQDSTPVAPSGKMPEPSPRSTPPPTPPRASPEEMPKEGRVGTLRVVSGHWADVYVDGKRKGRAPMGSISLPVGKHVVELRGNPRIKDYRVEGVIKAGETWEVVAESIPVD
ncbi:hypothetical protein F0U59_43170 [Archangium gephyra]|nr:hypothetical protein F0U59_43170 [Archangium gephyra]